MKEIHYKTTNRAGAVNCSVN